MGQIHHSWLVANCLFRLLKEIGLVERQTMGWFFFPPSSLPGNKLLTAPLCLPYLPLAKTNVSEWGHCYSFERDFIFVVPVSKTKLWWFEMVGAKADIVSISILGLSPGEMKRSFKQLFLRLPSDYLSPSPGFVLICGGPQQSDCSKLEALGCWGMTGCKEQN